MAETDHNARQRLLRELTVLRQRFEALEREIWGEQNLAPAESVVEAIVSSLPDIVYRLDCDGYIVFISDAISKYGYDPHKLVGTSIFEIIHPDDHAKAHNRINDRRTGDRSTKSLQLRLLSVDQTEFAVEVHESAVAGEPTLLVDAEGVYSSDDPHEEHFLYTQGVARDISERRRIEEEMQSARDAMVKRVADHSLQVQQTYEQLQAETEGRILREKQGTAVDRVRARIWNMASPEDIRLVLEEIAQALLDFGVDFASIGVNVADQRSGQVRVFAMVAGSEWRTIDAGPGTEIIMGFFRGREVVYRDDLELDDPYGERERVSADAGVAICSVIDVPFSHGTFAVNSTRKQAYSDSDIHLLRSLAQVVGEGFRRLDDLQAIESRRREDIEALERSEARYRDLLDQLPVGVTHTTPDGEIVYLNSYARAMLGYSGDEVAGALNVAELFAQRGDLEELNRILEARGVHSYEYELKRKSGRKIWVRGTSRAVRNAATSRLEFHGFVEDVSDRKLMEDEYARLEEQLRQTQKMEAVGQLTAGIAHNFNNMLQGIAGNVQLATMDAGDDIKGLLLDADNMTRRAADMITQLMMFARQGIKPGSRSVEIWPVVKSTIDICSRTFDRKIKITGVEPETEIRITGDDGLLQQVLMNLCINARDALEEKPVEAPFIRVTIDLVRCDEAELASKPEIQPGSFARIQVSDNGAGMDDATRSRIFDPFFTTKPMEKGTGLGLATVYGIVSEHRGWIDCASEVGVGTQFTMHLPSLGRNPKEDAANEDDRFVVGGGSERILMVDDENVVRGSTASLLRRHGYRVVEAEDGASGLAAFKGAADAFDLVLLDLSMPTMSGTEVLAEIRRLDPSVAVIIFTGYAAHAEALKGATAVLQKPFAAGELTAAIRGVFDG